MRCNGPEWQSAPPDLLEKDWRTRSEQSVQPRVAPQLSQVAADGSGAQQGGVQAGARASHVSSLKIGVKTLGQEKNLNEVMGERLNHLEALCLFPLQSGWLPPWRAVSEDVSERFNVRGQLSLLPPLPKRTLEDISRAH